MKLKRQKGQYDCGVAVASMATGRSFATCREFLGGCSFGCLMSDMRRVCGGAISTAITERCILRLQMAQGSHFVLRWDGMTYDPAKGAYEAFPENVAEILNLIEN